jgi:hypothetical protein
MVEWLFGQFAAPEVVEGLWPDGPVFDYVMRTGMAAYVWIGVVLLVAATNPVKHRSQIILAIVALALLAVVCYVTGSRNGLPPVWYLTDTISSLAGAVLLALLRPPKEES